MKTKVTVAMTVLFTSLHAFAVYDPGEGRWMSRDPIEEEGMKNILPQTRHWVNRDFSEETHEPNLYAFCKNDSINKWDYLGLQASNKSGNPCKSNEDCLWCMVYAEARGQSDACQKAVAATIRNRISKNNSKRRDACAVVSERNGDEYNGYNTENYKNCCLNCIPDKARSDYDKTKQLRDNDTGEDPTNGAEYLHNTSIDTPDWIKRKIAKGEMKEIKVEGCDKFRFHKVIK